MNPALPPAWWDPPLGDRPAPGGHGVNPGLPPAWLDHLPPWLAWGAIASTGAYGAVALVLMAAPLALAALVQARRWSLQGWQKGVELGALAGVLFLLLARCGWLPTVVHTLFLLCGARLALPRERPQQRQLLLMGFLLFLTTALTTSELDFLFWSLVWAAGAATVLLGQTWARSARLRPGARQAPPFRLVLPWTALVVLLAAGFFVTLPRLRMGFRGLPLGIPGIKGGQGGLNDFLDPAGKGSLHASREVALRVVPAANQRQGFRSAGELLRCFVLEDLEGQRWQVAPDTFPRATVHWSEAGRRPLRAEFFLGPSLLGILPLPYGETDLEPYPGDTLQGGRGGAVRFLIPDQRTRSLQVAFAPADVEAEPAPAGARLACLTAPGEGTGSALRWSLQAAPGEVSGRELAQRLTRALRTFRYTLDNPSGRAANPLADFLERTQAGHCEYFASALALMLRQRGVPSRVAAGYRLGPWIEEGGYFLVTQDEAHSWVEYYDFASAGWRVADPTPPAPPSGLAADSLAGTLARWSDALKFQWDRHVVHFSDEDQVVGLDWLQAHARLLTCRKPSLPSPGLQGCLLAGAGLLALLGARRAWPRPLGGSRINPGARVRELAPLLRKVRKHHPPGPGETAQAWLGRLARVHPARSAALLALAREVDAVAYGGKAPGALKALVKAECQGLAGIARDA